MVWIIPLVDFGWAVWCLFIASKIRNFTCGYPRVDLRTTWACVLICCAVLLRLLDLGFVGLPLWSLWLGVWVMKNLGLGLVNVTDCCLFSRVCRGYTGFSPSCVCHRWVTSDCYPWFRGDHPPYFNQLGRRLLHGLMVSSGALPNAICD